MLKRLRPGRSSPAMVVAVIALVGAFGGSAVADEAVDFAKTKLISGKRLKARSVAGGKLARNTVGGTEVDESKLGKVPSAGNADRATNATNASNAANADNATNAQSAATAAKATTATSAEDAEKLDGIDSGGFVQGKGKTYVGRVVVPTSNPFPDENVLVVPGYGTVSTLNCQGGGANVSLHDFQQTRGTFTMWRDVGDADPAYFSSPGALSWSSNFQVTERTTWHMSVGTGSSAEAATIDVYTRVDGSNCIYSATAQVWGP